eukprot:TRINITY_DN4223_c0_g2_i3.p1 TRINITY_DN4223_c0_g2~~TRINITY_DN4223_c0_g2_i3.p1  ORF type:complete len:266 (-),score=30.38 TRINITY_DN4223_c0_g2_i3:411-1208(-)
MSAAVRSELVAAQQNIAQQHHAAHPSTHSCRSGAAGSQSVFALDQQEAMPPVQVPVCDSTHSNDQHFADQHGIADAASVNHIQSWFSSVGLVVKSTFIDVDEGKPEVLRRNVCALACFPTSSECPCLQHGAVLNATPTACEATLSTKSSPNLFGSACEGRYDEELRELASEPERDEDEDPWEWGTVTQQAENQQSSANISDAPIPSIWVPRLSSRRVASPRTPTSLQNEEGRYDVQSNEQEQQTRGKTGLRQCHEHRTSTGRILL